MGPSDGVTIIIPAFNEEAGIARVIRDLQAALAGYAAPYEVIVVDDGSFDDTAARVPVSDQVRVIRHPKNRGYGASLKTGIRAARHAVVAITDADGTYPVKALPGFVDRLVAGDLDMVVGARMWQQRVFSPGRDFVRGALRALASFLTEQHIPDINSGLRVMRKKTVEEFLYLLPDGFSFTTTITISMLANGKAVDFQPVAYAARAGKSKIHPIKDTCRFFVLILSTATIFQPLRVFLPVSLFFFCAGVALLGYRAFVERSFLAVTMICFVASLQLLCFGLLAEAIRKTRNAPRS